MLPPSPTEHGGWNADEDGSHGKACNPNSDGGSRGGTGDSSLAAGVFENLIAGLGHGANNVSVHTSVNKRWHPS